METLTDNNLAKMSITCTSRYLPLKREIGNKRKETKARQGLATDYEHLLRVYSTFSTRQTPIFLATVFSLLPEHFALIN